MTPSEPGRSEPPLPSRGEQRFDLAQLAREAGTSYRRLAPVIIGVGVVFVAFWALLAVGFVQSGYDYVGSFVVLTVVLLGAGTLCVWLGDLVRHNLFPVAVSIGESGIKLDYLSRRSWSVSWSDPKLNFVIADQRSSVTPQLPDLSAFGAMFPRAPFVPGQYFPLTPDAYHTLLERARERRLSAEPRDLMIASGRVRVAFSRGTIAYWIRRPGA